MSSSIDSENKWVVVSLSPIGERETNINIINKAVKAVLRTDLKVFIPAVSKKARSESHTIFYMDGYVFVEFREKIQYTKLQDTTYFSQVLCNGRNYHLMSDKELDPLRDGVKKLGTCKFSIDDKVRVVKGEFKNLRGVVKTIYDNNEVVQVDVSQRSKPMLIDFPIIYLDKVKEHE